MLFAFIHSFSIYWHLVYANAPPSEFTVCWENQQNSLYILLSLCYLVSFYTHVYYLFPSLDCEAHEGRDWVYILTIQAGPTTRETFICEAVEWRKVIFWRHEEDKMGAQRRDAFLSTRCDGRLIGQKGIKSQVRVEARGSHEERGRRLPEQATESTEWV